MEGVWLNESGRGAKFILVVKIRPYNRSPCCQLYDIVVAFHIPRPYSISHIVKLWTMGLGWDQVQVLAGEFAVCWWFCHNDMMLSLTKEHLIIQIRWTCNMVAYCDLGRHCKELSSEKRWKRGKAVVVELFSATNWHTCRRLDRGRLSAPSFAFWPRFLWYDRSDVTRLDD
jgi:hypothetical protein